MHTDVRTTGVVYWCLSSSAYDRNEAGFLEFGKLVQGSGKSSESLPSDEQKAFINNIFISKRHSHRKLRKAGLKPWNYTQKEGGDCTVHSPSIQTSQNLPNSEHTN